MADDDPSRNSDRRSSSPVATRRSSTASGVNNLSEGQSIQAPEGQRRRSQPHQYAAGGYGTMASSSTGRPLIVGSPEVHTTPMKPKKPGMGRRTISHGPHRGQEFSVDDALSEVDEDLAQQRQARLVSGVLRRQPSTLRRRTLSQQPALSPVASFEDDTAHEDSGEGPSSPEGQPGSSGEEGTLQAEEERASDEGDHSDAESFTLKDRQEAINETHPFGIRIWKPALYKKSRSVQRTAEADVHSTPGGYVSNWLLFFNISWTLLFGWWLGLLAAAGALVCLVLGFSEGCMEYGKVLWGLAGYLLYPFGKFVKLMQDEAYAEEDEGEGRSISEYEQWQSGDIEEGRLFFGPNSSRSLVGRRRDSRDSTDETDSLLGRAGRTSRSPQGPRAKRRLFGRGKWNIGRVVFFIVFYGLLTPSLAVVSGICWLLVFSIPMGKVTYLLFDHLRRHPLALSFHSDTAGTRRPGESSSILLCTYRAVGIKYWKYTIDGTNIFFINLLAVVAFVIFDYWVLDVGFGVKNALTSQGFIFILALCSIIPLAYFIGQAVASISAQSSMGLGATINAFFSTVVEVFLYCVALKEGKAPLVEGSIIGSIFAGILFLPGISMCFGALKRKTQRFNVKSAGVTSTMLLFAVIGAFGPTLFYKIYGSHELRCHSCHKNPATESERDCRRCYFTQTPAVHDRFFVEAIKPYIWFAAVLLFLSYVIGLLFTLRTHAAVIWSSDLDEKKIEKLDQTASLYGQDPTRPSATIRPNASAFQGDFPRSDIRESQLYKRILGQSLKQVGLSPAGLDSGIDRSKLAAISQGQTPHVVPSREAEIEYSRNPRAMHVEGLSDDQNQSLARQVAEVAATAVTVAARDATKAPRRTSQIGTTPAKNQPERPHVQRSGTFGEDGDEFAPVDVGHTSGGHDAPNWSRAKSAIILLTATVAYAIIAEMLVNTVDAVLDNIDIDEKFLGITLFALVPNTTEFLNAISFAMNGNIALSMEIGSAYALQVCLLQIPALVLFSAVHEQFLHPEDVINHSFILIFPQWDMVTVILCVFLLSYMYGEGKSNYFKGSILILSYLVVVVGFYLSSLNDVNIMGVDHYDTLAVQGIVRNQFETFSSAGRASYGQA